MKILGIGNAIVDVLCKVSDEFLIQHSLTKSTMKLIDEVEFKNLLASLKIEETISGGSVANSIVGLSQLKNNVGFIGKVSDDIFGAKYEEGLKKENVKYYYKKKNYAFLIEEKDLSNNLLYLMKEIYGNKSVLDKIKLNFI